jgi:hypothetical protein
MKIFYKTTIVAAILWIMAAALWGCGGSTDQIGEEESVTAFDNKSLQECSPNTFDLELARSLGLADQMEFSDEYFQLQAYYTKALMIYLDDVCSIVELDQTLAQREEHFLANEEPVDIYQKNISFGMSFFFLRSNVCIERLGEDELRFLREAYADETECDDASLQQLVADTFANVTQAEPNQEGNVKIIFDMGSGKAVRNASVVLGLSTRAEYDEDGYFVSAEHEAEKQTFLQAAISVMAEEMSDRLQYPVEILLY